MSGCVTSAWSSPGWERSQGSKRRNSWRPSFVSTNLNSYLKKCHSQPVHIPTKKWETNWLDMFGKLQSHVLSSELSFFRWSCLIRSSLCNEFNNLTKKLFHHKLNMFCCKSGCFFIPWEKIRLWLIPTSHLPFLLAWQTHAQLQQEWTIMMQRIFIHGTWVQMKNLMLVEYAPLNKKHM